MSTSNSYSFTINRDQIIRAAMLNLGKLGENEGPTAQETQDCAMFLNMLVKTWMGQADYSGGLKMWTRRQGHLFLSTTTGTYQLGANSTANWTNSYQSTTLSAQAATSSTTIQVDSIQGISNGDYLGIQLNDGYQNGNLFWTTVSGTPSGSTITFANALPDYAAVGGIVYAYTTKAQLMVVPETCVLRDSQKEDVPINFWTVQDYQFAPSKADPNYISDPVSVYVERNLKYSTVYTDVAGASDVSKHLVLEYMEPIQDFVNPLDEPEYPQEWFRALVWGLTKEICPMFNGVWTQDMQSNYVEAVSIARNLDPNKTAMYFQCNDWQGNWNNSY